jgi:hypothetical protein
VPFLVHGLFWAPQFAPLSAPASVPVSFEAPSLASGVIEESGPLSDASVFIDPSPCPESPVAESPFIEESPLIIVESAPPSVGPPLLLLLVLPLLLPLPLLLVLPLLLPLLLVLPLLLPLPLLLVLPLPPLLLLLFPPEDEEEDDEPSSPPASPNPLLGLESLPHPAALNAKAMLQNALKPKSRSSKRNLTMVPASTTPCRRPQYASFLECRLPAAAAPR